MIGYNKEIDEFIEVPEEVDADQWIENHLDSEPDDYQLDKFFSNLFEDKLEVKIKPLVPLNEFTIPYKGSAGAACFDVKAVNIEYKDNNEVVIKFGFSTEIPEGWKGVIVPRSSFTKTEWIMQNSPAQIDSDYRGEWLIKLRYIGKSDSPQLPINVGDRAAQIYFERVNPVQFVLVDELVDSERSDGGFGSTGK